MQLRTIDPRSLTLNANNPRKVAAPEDADRALIASIKAIGVLQPPVVRERDGGLEIVYGNRRTRAAIALDLQEINVLVLDENDHVEEASPGEDGVDQLRSLSENVVRAPMNTVDVWRAIEALTAQNWTEEAIALALATPIRQIKKLRLLAHIHPAILDQFAAGDMPKEEHLRTIAAATTDEQASVWKKLKPKKGQTATWWEIARTLEKRRIYARVAKFGPELEHAYGIVWEEDLFTQGDDDSRYTTQVEAFFGAQQEWLHNHLPKNGTVLQTDDYGNPKLPPKAERLWTKPKKGDILGFCVNARDGSIVETAFRLPQPEAKKGRALAADPETDSVAPVVKTRPDLTQKGMEIVGALRSAALGKALFENPIDDVTLIGLLVLGFSAQNVTIRTNGYLADKTRPIIQRVTDGGRLTQDLDIVRQAAREMLAILLSARPGMNDSGIVARFTGDAIGADQHLPNMATEDFLSCLSKAAIEKAASSVSVLPRQRAKDTRAALIAHIGDGTFVHPAALFAPTETELAHHRDSLARSPCWSDDETEETANADDAAMESADGELVTAREGEDDGFPEENSTTAFDHDDDSLDPDDDPSSSYAFGGDDSFAGGDDIDENAHLDDKGPQPSPRRLPKKRGAADHLGRA